MWIERTLSSELTRLTQTFPVVVVVGPRQVGKTSLLERAFPKFGYVSLDDPSLASMAETLPEQFLALHPPPVVIDEIQYAPALFRHLKSVVDARRGENGLFVLTGSQNFMMMHHLSESLAGRAAVVPLLGLSGSEWANAVGVRPNWMDFLWRGSYPGLWGMPESPPDRDRWYQGYLATYLERDVRNLLNVGSLRDFDRFLRALAIRTGALLNMSDLARDVGIAHATARQWLAVLQASNLVMLLEPYHRSLGKRLVKTPKVYFTDTGLAAYLMGFQSESALLRSAAAGALFETYVVGQWLRHRDWCRPSWSLWFWQDRAGNEVDLLIESDQRLWAVECKLSSRPGPDDVRGIRKLQAFYGENTIAGAFIASTAEGMYEASPGVLAGPGWVVGAGSSGWWGPQLA